eukprot:593620-Pelagomonas_calceolata.AAC.3
MLKHKVPSPQATASSSVVGVGEGNYIDVYHSVHGLYLGMRGLFPTTPCVFLWGTLQVPWHGDCVQHHGAFPGTVVVDMAARQGCIMLSMDVCELRQVTQLRPAGPAGISQEALVQRAIQEWLREAGLEGGLGDGTVMSVQVCSLEPVTIQEWLREAGLEGSLGDGTLLIYI